MKVTTYDTLYHEDHGAILKHKCGKRDSSIVPSLFFSHFFIGPFLFFYGHPFFYISSGVSSRLMGESQSPSSFPHWDNALIMMIITLLFFYNSTITTRYLEQNMTLYECLRRYTRICNESRATCMKNMMVALPQIRCQLHDHAKSNMTKVMCVI